MRRSARTNKSRPRSASSNKKKSPVRFRRREATRAIKAMVDADLSIARVEIGPDGRITIVAGKPADGELADTPERIISQL
jgi:hypothetical protein